MNWAYNLQQQTDLADGLARFEAINPQGSYIVQAPAGSGKTAILTQRFLALLATVDAPEQVVAMTFTKKAAAEMRERVLAALKLGLEPSCGSERIYDQNTWQLAQRVLERDRRQAWSLLSNPNRLRIRTIDSLNGYLVQQMPFLSRLGTQPSLNTQQDSLYVEVARATLRDESISEAVAGLLRLVNGRYTRAESLLVSMLKSRDQWMRLVWQQAERSELEKALEDLILSQLQPRVVSLSKTDVWRQLPALAVYAQTNGMTDLDKLVQASWPFPTGLAGLCVWRQAARFVLTSSGGLRKRLTKNEGFPAGKGEAQTQKDAMMAVLSDLSATLSTAQLEALNEVMKLPDPVYSDQQWQDLSFLVRVLKQAVAHLTLVFKANGEADFIELAQAASQALGDEETPTDLALRLDYQIQHLLIDEFQDTSVAQFELVKKLLRGWLPNDGRTLFIVGDPMQSIYRFREAEVGNFLKAWQGQDFPLQLNRLSLTVNFRSNEGLVEWFNQTFATVFPMQDDLVLGAVSYAKAQASPTACPTPLADAVQMHWALNQTSQQEAQTITALIKQLTAAGKKVAVLGRSRSHLAPLAALLKSQHQPFRAVELEALSERQEVQDVLALTRALLHLADRPAWIALLRCPFIGLGLSDLYALLGQDRYRPVADLLADDQAWLVLSDQTQARLKQAWPILHETINKLGEWPFSKLIYQAWLRLGGAQSVMSAVELDNVQVFIETLAQYDGELLTPAKLDAMVTQLYAAGDSHEQAAQVQLMTMHKSKGLQFECVILPGLGKKPRADDKGLVNWLEFASEQGEGLVLAPLDQRGDDSSALNQLIRQLEAQKQAFEDARLLYVAATRAEQQLYLFGSVSCALNQIEQEKPLVPAAKSLLSAFWPQVAADFELLIPAETVRLSGLPATDPQTLMLPKVSRLPWPRSDLVAQSMHTVSFNQTHRTPLEDLTTTGLATALTPGKLAPAVGTLVHTVLQQVAEQGLAAWSESRLTTLQPALALWLAQQGLDPEQVELALARVLTSLRHALANPNVRWALSEAVTEARCEWALSSKTPDGQVENHIIDRSFIDADGVRWIVDYKTSRHEGQDLDGFLLQKVAEYRPQLARYGELLAQMESRPQKWALYFSDADRWIELESDH